MSMQCAMALVKVAIGWWQDARQPGVHCLPPGLVFYLLAPPLVIWTTEVLPFPRVLVRVKQDNAQKENAAQCPAHNRNSINISSSYFITQGRRAKALPHSCLLFSVTVKQIQPFTTSSSIALLEAQWPLSLTVCLPDDSLETLGDAEWVCG